MSETETWTGVAKVVKPNAGDDLEAQCKRLCEEAGVEKKSYHKSWEEVFNDHFYKGMAIAGGVIYDVSQMREFEYEDICEASRIDADSINVTLKFYNGGTCFSEMFEEAVAKLSKTNPV
jgi:hypothetical protein